VSSARRWKRALLALLGCLALGEGSALAATPEKRKLPDYDGRGGPHDSAGRKLLWVPRILLSPLYFVSEFVVRRPLGFAITAAEKAELPRVLYDFFVFGPDHKAGIVPVAFLDFGFLPSVGLYAFWDDAGFKGHDLRLHGSTWGAQWLSGAVTERFRIDDRFTLALSATATKRPDYAFYGIGPDTLQSALVRYAAKTVDVRAETSVAFAGSSFLETGLGYRGASFAQTHFRGEPSVVDAVDSGTLDQPPGFDEGYRAGFARGRLVLDSRNPKGSATGVRLEALGEQGADWGTKPASGWVRYGGTLGGFVDLTHTGRVLGLSVTGLLSDPLGTRPVPFTELVQLGGSGLMPGFRQGRLFGRSGAVATLRYSWPIWIWLNGSLQAATGNVFGERFEGFRANRARFSGAIGIESSGSRDSVFQALFGFGTETIEDGAKLDSLRVVVGARSGF
jgi:hypothetical protein